MKRITNRSEFEELIERISECLEWYEKNKFNDKVYNLLLDNGDKLKIVFDRSSIAHLLGINTEYLKSTGLFKGNSYDILKQICNDSYRLYNMVRGSHIAYNNFISDYAWEKVESFERICGINISEMEFVCKYTKENSYITGYSQLEGDYYIAYRSNNGLFIIGFKKEGDYYYPMTNRPIDLSKKESKEFLNILLTKQSITMATYSNYNFRNVENFAPIPRNTNVYLEYNKKASIIRDLLQKGEEYDASVDVSVGYSYVIEKLLSKFDSNKKIYLAFQIAFEYIIKGSKINIKKVKNNCGDLPEEIFILMEQYNNSVGGNNFDYDDTYEESRASHIDELESLKKQLLEQQAIIERLEQENAKYQEREDSIRRVLSIK